MTTIKLTPTSIERDCKPKPGAQTVYWDTETKGLGVLASGATGTKTFVVQRKLIDRKTRRITIGPIAMGLKQARVIAARHVADMLGGKDPKAETRAAKRRGLTLRQAMMAYVTDKKNLSERSKTDYRGIVEVHLKDWLDQPLREITVEKVKKRYAAIADEVAARRPGSQRGGGPVNGHATANSVMRVLRAVWFHQIEDDATFPPNPVKLGKGGWFRLTPRRNSVKRNELPVFYEAVDALPSRIQCDYLKLVLFTGLRKGEAAGLRWEEVDLDERIIRLPERRTKTRRALDLPMSDFVHDLLVALRGFKDGPFVFPSDGESGHFEASDYALGKVGEACGISVATHDLRRTFITVANSVVSGRDSRALTNHSVGGNVHDDYDMVEPEELREAAQKVGAKMVNLCAIEPLPEGVERIA